MKTAYYKNHKWVAFIASLERHNYPLTYKLDILKYLL